jgi:alpha-N-acetylglucosaminidase
MKKLIGFIVMCLFPVVAFANPITGLLERIDKGASKKFVIEIKKDGLEDYFELSQSGQKIKVCGNNYICVATGINWYLKYYAGIHLSWNGMKAKLPRILPPVKQPERHETTLKERYYLNYCTFSYTMAFWDWNRWQQEIDWMALHGINMPLDIVGEECVWYNLLHRLGYTKAEINSFIAGPAFVAWWAMGNLEGWGGPNPDSWYVFRLSLGKKILDRMKAYGMRPVFPGYAGMVPHNAGKKLHLDIAELPLWCGYHRPSVLQPTDRSFQKIASMYYQEQEKLFGKADFYSMDPFHESGQTGSMDLASAGKAIMAAMKKVNPKAVWVAQGWQENPREAMMKDLKPGDFLVLDLESEKLSGWYPGKYRKSGFGQQDWLFCMLLNFGGRVGLYGRMDELLDHFYLAKIHPSAAHLKGIGLTPEGIENNPVMYELMTELPWRSKKFDKISWVNDYVFARYGVRDRTIQKAWKLLADGIYNCPASSDQEGPHESIFCSLPSLNSFQVSSWSRMQNYYDPASTEEAARLMLSVADKYKGNNNFEYDLVDIVRQALADHARIVYNRTVADFKSFDRKSFNQDSRQFLNLLLLQDSLLGTRREFRVGTWIQSARKLGATPEEKDLYEWNARVQIIIWGNRTAAIDGGLREYAHKEWNGVLRDFYYPRWKAYLRMLGNVMDGKPMGNPDYYAMAEPWVKAHNTYASTVVGSPVDVAKGVFVKAFGSY